jgi:hypothetical protein
MHAVNLYQDSPSAVRAQRAPSEAEDGFAGLKVLVRAAAKVVLALERETLEPLLRNPRLTGNRPLGWNFARDSDIPAEYDRDTGQLRFPG